MGVEEEEEAGWFRRRRHLHRRRRRHLLLHHPMTAAPAALAAGAAARVAGETPAGPGVVRASAAVAPARGEAAPVGPEPWAAAATPPGRQRRRIRTPRTTRRRGWPTRAAGGAARQGVRSPQESQKWSVHDNGVSRVGIVSTPSSVWRLLRTVTRRSNGWNMRGSAGHGPRGAGVNAPTGRAVPVKSFTPV